MVKRRRRRGRREGKERGEGGRDSREGRGKREQEEGREGHIFSGEEACMSSPNKIQQLISHTISPSCDLPSCKSRHFPSPPLSPAKSRVQAQRRPPLTHSEDQVVFDGVLFSLPGAVHAGGPLDCLLLHMAAARGLHAPLHALGGGGHIRRADHLQLERAAADVLVVEPQRQREVALLLHGVQELVGAVLVVQDLPVGHAAVGRAQLRREVGVARFAQLAVFVLGCYGNRHGLPDDGLPQPLARRHRLGGDGVGGQNRPEVVDGLLEPLGLHDEVQLVVFSRVQREILVRQFVELLAHLLLHQQHLRLRAVVQGLRREAAAALDALLPLEQGVQLRLEDLRGKRAAERRPRRAPGRGGFGLTQ